MTQSATTGADSAGAAVDDRNAAASNGIDNVAADIPPYPVHRRTGRATSSVAGRTSGTSTAHSTRRTRPGRWRRWIGAVPAEKTYLLDMFPYPSGEGLHVGHPLGYVGTDVLGRFLRMTGRNVLHTIGYDAFGLPAEQYAVRTGTHPRTTTEANIARYRAQLRRLGFAHDQRPQRHHHGPGVLPLDPVDLPAAVRRLVRPGRPSGPADRRAGRGVRRRAPPDVPGGRNWAELSRAEQQRVLAGYRLAYIDEAPVNWCPGLGTVLSNEEITAEGLQRDRQLPGVPAQPAAVDDADHRLRGPADRRPGSAGLAGLGEAHAAQLDRTIHRRQIRFPGLGGRWRCVATRSRAARATRRVGRGLHHQAGHLVRRDVHGAGAGAPAGRRDHRPRMAVRDRRSRGPAGQHTPPLPSPTTGGRRPASPTWIGRRTATRPGSSPAPMPPIRPPTPCCRCSSPTTC